MSAQPDLKTMYHKIVQDAFPDKLTITLGDERLEYTRRTWAMDGEVRGLRYGENPDQAAALYELSTGGLALEGRKWRGPGQGIVSAMQEGQMIQAGKHPGKTNLTDVDNGANILQYLSKRPAAAILKHNNPCGAAWADTLRDALVKAFWCDRIAAFGGAVVVNRPLDVISAEFLAQSYFEVVAAPAYEQGVLEVLAKRKNLRVLELPQLGHLQDYAGIPMLDIKSLMDGGLVLQQSFVNRIAAVEDFIPASATNAEGVSCTTRSPSKAEAQDLFFAWAVESGVTSNSVIFAKDGATVAIGTGEQDRVGCVELAIHKAYTKYADKLSFDRWNLSIYDLQRLALSNAEAAERLAQVQGESQKARGGLPCTVLVSDGFFPFRDGVDTAIAQGVTAIAQPGGSVRDAEVIMACNEASPQVAMVYTGQRSFKH